MLFPELDNVLRADELQRLRQLAATLQLINAEHHSISSESLVQLEATKPNLYRLWADV